MKNLGVELPKKRNSCTTTGSFKMDRTYVTILFEKDATEWNTYVRNCFTHILETYSLQDWSIDSQKLKDIQLPLTPARIGPVKRARLQVIILSPRFLDFIASHPAVVFGQLFEPQRVICLLCGVKTEDINSSHRASLISYDDWHKMMVVDNDTEFAKKLFSITQELIENDLNIAECENSGFKLNPLKVREGFSKVTIELEEPIPNADKVTVYLTSKNNDTIPLLVKQYNPYTLKICVPERFFGESQYVHIFVMNDGESLGQRRLKCESKMAELNHLLEAVIDPFSFMCQTLGLPSGRNNRDGVDKYLVDCFNINSENWGPYKFELNKEDCLNRKSDENPTLLHWSARYGLQEFCSVLLNCSKAATACRIRNRNGLTAADVAEANGFSCLAKMLENFTKLSETAEMYIYMKDMTENIESVAYENLRVKCSDNCDIRFSNSSSLLNRHTISLGNDVSKVPTAQTIDKESKINCNKESESVTNGSADVVLRSKHCDSFEQELIQLMEDFKRDKYTLSEVETLCDHLHLTHKSRTFNEKQEQLNALRQQYEQTQSQRQQDGKKSFEIFRTLFRRNGKREAQISSPIIKVTTSYVKPRIDLDESLDNGNLVKSSRWKLRPTSSLSSGSRTSSSSDRSSTLSGVSSSSASDNALLDIDEEDRSMASSENSKIFNGHATVVQNHQYFGIPEFPNNNGSGKCRTLSESRQSIAVHLPHSQSKISKSSKSKKKDFKPEPLPRPDWLGKKSTHLNLSSSVDSSLFDDDVLGCPSEPPPPLPSNAGEVHFQSYFHPKSDVYTIMEGSKSAPSLAVVTNEPDYYNLPSPSRSYLAEYLEMRPSNNVGNSTNSCALYENTRVDQVPDVPPPAVPTIPPPRTVPPSAFSRYFNLKGSPPK